MAALSGAAAGAAIGGIAGALIGMGIPEIEAKAYDGKIRGGNILIAAHTTNSDGEKHAKQILEDNGAHDVSVVEETSPPKNAEAHPSH